MLQNLFQIDSQICAAVLGDAYELYELLHETAARLMPVDSCYVCLYSPDDRTLFFSYNVDNGVYDDPEVVPLGHGPTSWVVRNNASFVLTDGTTATQRGGRPFGDTAQVSRSAIHAPLSDPNSDVPLGVFSVQSYQPGVYSEEAVCAVGWLAERTGAALAQERREAQWRIHLEALEAKVAERKQQALAMADTFGQILKRITQEAEALRPLLTQNKEKLPASVAHLCHICYSGQTEVNLLPLRLGNPAVPADTLSPEASEVLTERETEILRLLASGDSNDKIAESLHISKDTVKFYCKKIYRKLEVKNRTEAARRALTLSSF